MLKNLGGEQHTARYVDFGDDFHAILKLLLLKVGEGRKAYESACKALNSWTHMSLGWVETNKPPVQVGSRVCIAAQMLCFWQRNPLQIVYVTEGKKSSSGLLQSEGQDSMTSSSKGML